MCGVNGETVSGTPTHAQHAQHAQHRRTLEHARTSLPPRLATSATLECFFLGSCGWGQWSKREAPPRLEENRAGHTPQRHALVMNLLRMAPSNTWFTQSFAVPRLRAWEKGDGCNPTIM